MAPVQNSDFIWIRWISQYSALLRGFIFAGEIVNYFSSFCKKACHVRRKPLRKDKKIIGYVPSKTVYPTIGNRLQIILHLYRSPIKLDFLSVQLSYIGIRRLLRPSYLAVSEKYYTVLQRDHVAVILLAWYQNPKYQHLFYSTLKVSQPAIYHCLGVPATEK